MSNNLITGTIPREFNRLEKLSEVILHNNKLTGPIPTFGIFVSDLILQNNFLTSTLPNKWFDKWDETFFQNLLLFGNDISGTLPTMKNSMVGPDTTLNFSPLFMIHNNRLSCDIHIDKSILHKYKNPSIYDNIVVLQNKFNYYSIKNSSMISDQEHYEILMVPKLIKWLPQFTWCCIYIIFLFYYFIRHPLSNSIIQGITPEI